MSQHIIQASTLTNIADAIRAKTGSNNRYTPAQMATAIANIQTNTSLGAAIINNIYFTDDGYLNLGPSVVEDKDGNEILLTDLEDYSYYMGWFRPTITSQSIFFCEWNDTDDFHYQWVNSSGSMESSSGEYSSLSNFLNGWCIDPEGTLAASNTGGMLAILYG